MALLRNIRLLLLLLLPCGSVDGVPVGPMEGGGGVLSLKKNDSRSRHDDAIFTGLAYWMSTDAAVVYPRTLAQLTLPGTHDSGAYRLTSQLMPDPRFPTPWERSAIELAERLRVPVDRVITPWALTQTLDVGEQLRAGYRYVDLRAGWNGTVWCAHHAEVGTPIRTILRHVAGFAAEYTGEVVVVQVSHLDGFPTDEQVRALAEMVGEELRGVLVPVVRLMNRTTVGDMVESGERVLVTFGNGDYENERRAFSNGLQPAPPVSSLLTSSSPSSSPPFPYSHLWPPWTLHNTYADTADPSEMVRYNRKQVAAFGGGSGGGAKGSLLKLSWTLTTQTSTVLESVLPSHPKSLRQLNELGKPLLAPFAEEVMAAGCRMGNILTVDFAHTSDAVKVARAMNNANPGGGVNCTLSHPAAATSIEA